MYDRVKTDNIDTYMHDIEEFHQITHERERDLFNIMQTGAPAEKEAAREELITSNLKLVIKIAHDYKRHNLPFSDLVQEGNIGLVIAADKFNPDKCPKFGVFASWWIKQRMRRAVIEKTGTVRVPNGAAQLAAKRAKFRSAYVAEHGVLPNDDQLAEYLGISKQRVAAIDHADFSTVSINAAVNDDEETTFEDMLSDRIDETAADTEETDNLVTAMMYAIDRCTDKEQFILRNFYGLNCKPVPIEVIAQEVGWNVSRIRGRLGNLKRKLQSLMEAA